MILFFTTLLFLPLSLHPAIGAIILKLTEGRRKNAFLLTVSFGLFYDLALNHLPFGFFTLLWLLAAMSVEMVRLFIFLGKATEVFFLTLLFSIVVASGEAFYLATSSAPFGELMKESLSGWLPLKEAFLALVLFWGLPEAKKLLGKRALQRAT